MGVVDPGTRHQRRPGSDHANEIGFDPARERAIRQLADEALDRTRGERAAVIDPDELIATGTGFCRLSLDEIGKPALLELAGKALRLAAGGRATRPEIARWVRHRTFAQACGEEVLPAAIVPGPWEAAAIVGFRTPALHTLQAITVAWPPLGAARLWHPPRAQTIGEVRAIAARALAEPDPLYPSEGLERTEWEETIPEDLLQASLRAYMCISVDGLEFGIRQVVRNCAEMNRILDSDDERYQIHSVVLDVAAVIDGAGFAGGATASQADLSHHMLAGLTSIPAELGRFARGVSHGATGASEWSASAMRTGLIALWVRGCGSGANAAIRTR